MTQSTNHGFQHKRSHLKRTASVAAMSVALLAAPVTTAYAQSTCDSFSPMSGDTVTCTFGSEPGTNDASPITMGINAPTAENVDLTIIDPIFRGFDQDASFSGGTPTIALGGGSTILVRNVSVSNIPLLDEGELAVTDFAAVFQEPYRTFFTDYVGLFEDDAVPTVAEAQQVLDNNGIDFTIDPDDPLGFELAFAAAFTDAGVPTTIELDDDGDPFLVFGGGDGLDTGLNDVFGFPVEGEALDALNSVLANADGAIVTLGAPTDRTAIDPTVIDRIATAPGTPAAVVAGQNDLTLGTFGGDDGDIFAIGANGVDLAQGSVTTIRANDDGIGVVGNGGATIILNAGGAETSAVEVILNPDAELTALGEGSAIVRVNGGNAVVGVASDIGSMLTLGDNSPLISITGGDSVLNLRLNELSTDTTVEFEAGAPYATVGDNSPLFHVRGDNTRVFLSSNQVGVRNPSEGLVSVGHDSSIFDFQIGAQPLGTADVTVNFDLLNAKASTSGDRSNILNLSTGSLNDADLLFGNAALATTGDEATAIEIAGAMNTNSIDLTVTAGSITTSGAESHGIAIAGGAEDGSDLTTNLNDVSITTSGAGSLGVDIGGASNATFATLVLDGGTISTAGSGAHGVRVSVAGATNGSISNVTLNNAQITTEGDGAFALISTALSDGGSAMSLSLSDVTLTTQGAGAGAAAIGLGASNFSVSTLSIVNSSLTTNGDFADGLAVSNALLDDMTTMSNMTGTVNTTTITTIGRFANALVVGEEVTVYGPGAPVPTDGAAKLTVDTFEDFSATGLGSRGVQNNGTIEVIGAGIAYSAGKTGRIANAGTINGADGIAVTFAGDTDDIFELQPTGITIGNVDGAGGTDTFILGGEGTDTFDSDLLDTQYVNFEIFEKEDLSTWTITSDDTRSWEVRGGDLVVDSGTTLTNAGAPTVVVTEGLSSTVRDGTEQLIKTRGQLVISIGGAVTSSNVDVAAVLVDGAVLTEELPVVDGRPAEDINLAFRQRTFEPTQTFADVRVAGLLDTTGNGAVGIQARTLGDAAPMATISIEGDGRIQTSGAGASAIAGAATGSTTLTVFADEDSAIRTTGADAFGVGAAGGNNAINVALLDNVSIETLGAGASAFASLGDASVMTVTANGSITISTMGDGARSIVTDGNGGVLGLTFTQGVSVTTAGDNAAAVSGPGSDSVTTLTTNGTSRFATSGNSSTVIEIDDFNSSIASFDFELDAARTQQTLLSSGANSHLLSVSSAGIGQSTFVFTAEGLDSAYAGADFETEGDGAFLTQINAGDESSITMSIQGIDAITRGAGAGGFQAAAGAGGDLTYFAEDTTIVTEGANATALDTRVGAEGLVDTILLGTDVTTNGDGSTAVFISAGAGAILSASTTANTIRTTGADGVGLLIEGAVDGTNTIRLAGTIGTEGARSHAVWLDRQVEDFELIGALSTDGDNAKGIGADGSLFNIVTSATSTITTTGVDSDAIWLGSDNQFPLGTAAVTQLGAITTAGDGASGIWASTLPGDAFDDGLVGDPGDILSDVAIIHRGSIDTSGDDAYGIGVEGDGFTILVEPADSVAGSGAITTTGINADGIWANYISADSVAEDGSITMNGAIDTQGNEADGIWVGYSGDDDGGLVPLGSITVGGTIETSGMNAFGVGVDGGAATITLAQGGEILTQGTGSDGIWLDRRGVSNDVASLIDVDGLIRASGDDAHGITVFYGPGTPMNAGNAGSIEISGNVEGGGLSESSDGVRVYLDNGASTSITIESGGDVFSGGGTNSRGIYLTALPSASGTASANILVEGRVPDVSAAGNVFSSNGTVIAEGDDGGGAIVIDTTLDIAGQVVAGGSDRVAIDLGAGTDTVFIREGGSVNGGIDLGSDNDVISVAGSVRAFSVDAINTGTGDDELIVLPTATFTGDGGIDMGPGEDTLAFDGAAGTVGNVSLVADEVVFALDVDRIEKRGEGTWIFEGDDIPAGEIFEPAFLLDGTSRVLAQYSAIDTTVSAPARIEGTGGVGDLINAGTFAPGVDGVGTFRVAGDLTLQSTSTLEIDITAGGAADLIEVGDDAAIDGTLAVNGVMYPTGYPNQQDYVIITAAESVTGTFATVTDNLPDVDVTVAYNANDVTISYDRGQDESDKTIQANTVQSGLVDGRLFAHTLRRRGVLMGASGGFAEAGNIQTAQTGDPTGLVAAGKRYSVWAAAMGAAANVDGSAGRNGYDLGLGGLASGFDGFIPLEEGLVRLGVAFGYTTGDIDNALSGADVDTWHLGAHAVYENGPFGISGAVSYGFQNYDIDRVIELIGAPSVTATGEADGSVFSLSIGAKYTVYETETFTFSPIAHVEHVSAKRDAYTESGAGILDLFVDEERFNRTFVGAGVRLEGVSETGSVTIRPQLDLMYEHAFGDDSAVVGSNAVNVQNATFVTRGGNQASDQIAVGAGFAIEISERLSAHIRYDGNYGGGFTSHRGSAGFAWSF